MNKDLINWLNEDSYYLNYNDENKLIFSDYYLKNFNLDFSEKSLIYRKNDIDINSCFCKKIKNLENGAKTRTSDKFLDLEISIPEFINRHNCIFLYKELSNYLNNIENEIPILNYSNKNFNYSKKKINNIPNKTSFYKFLYENSYT